MINNYILSRESVTVILNGKPSAVTSDHPHYGAIVDACKAGDWDKASTLINIRETITRSFGDVTIEGDKVFWRGLELNGYLVGKILEAPDNVEPLARFLDNVMLNPDPRARTDLFAWVEAGEMPITTDGQVLAYKYVNSDFKDCYTGTFDHSPGKVVSMPREDCDANPDVTCSRGLHFCSRSYLSSYGDGHKLVKLKVHPADVVAFPRDYGLSKGRACRYQVLEEIPWETRFDSSGYTDTGRYYIVDCSGDYVNFSDYGHDYAEKKIEAKTYTRSEADDYIAGYDGVWDPLRLVLADDDTYYVRDTDGDFWFVRDDGTISYRSAPIEVSLEDAAKLADKGERILVDPNLPEGNRFIVGGNVVDRYEALKALERGETVEEEAVTVLNRVIAIEAALGLSSAGAFPERLDAIDRELGLEPIEPLIARIERAESQLGLS